MQDCVEVSVLQFESGYSTIKKWLKYRFVYFTGTDAIAPGNAMTDDKEWINMKNEVMLANLTIDCDDEDAMQKFYGSLLGWEKVNLYGHQGLHSPSGLTFLFVRESDFVRCVWPEEEGKQQKQIHLDFLVDDLAAAVKKAVELGAVKAKAQFGGDDFITMIDPSGHPLCLCRKG